MTQDSFDPLPGSGVASDQIEILAERGEDAARRLSEAFEEAGDTIASSLEAAARSGELNFSDMAEAILQDLARIALEMLVIDPILSAGEQIGANVLQSLGSVIGQRALGGPVLAGEPYLVGERGPEVFVPSGGGSIAPTGPSQIINITIQGGRDPAGAVQRSERQITAAIARAAAAGGRLL
jgi:phage-related minor tail protein